MKKGSKYKHPSFTEISLLFVELENHELGTIESKRLLDNIANMLYYIPSVMVQRYKWSTSVEEMHAAGLEGLAKAIDRYDYRQNNNFFLYSFRTIHGEITREQKREIKWTELSKTCSPVEEYEAILPGDGDPEQDMIKKENLIRLEKLINSLDIKSKQVISMCLGIEGERRSLRYIAKNLGLCHETVRRIRDDTVEKLKEIFASQ